MLIGARPHVCRILFDTFNVCLNSCRWFVVLCPEIGTSSIDWVQLSTLYLKMETESSLRNVVLNKNQNHG
jgi:hypothetical protein